MHASATSQRESREHGLEIMIEGGYTRGQGHGGDVTMKLLDGRGIKRSRLVGSGAGSRHRHAHDTTSFGRRRGGDGQEEEGVMVGGQATVPARKSLQEVRRPSRTLNLPLARLEPLPIFRQSEPWTTTTDGPGSLGTCTLSSLSRARHEARLARSCVASAPSPAPRSRPLRLPALARRHRSSSAAHCPCAPAALLPTTRTTQKRKRTEEPCLILGRASG